MRVSNKPHMDLSSSSGQAVFMCFGGMALTGGMKGERGIFYGCIPSKSSLVILVSPAFPAPALTDCGLDCVLNDRLNL